MEAIEVNISVAAIMGLIKLAVTVGLIVLMTYLFANYVLPTLVVKRKKSLRNEMTMLGIAIALIILMIIAVPLTSPFNPFGITLSIESIWGIIYLIISIIVFIAGYIACGIYYAKTNDLLAHFVFGIMLLALAGILFLILT